MLAKFSEFVVIFAIAIGNWYSSSLGKLIGGNVKDNLEGENRGREKS